MGVLCLDALSGALVFLTFGLSVLSQSSPDVYVRGFIRKLTLMIIKVEKFPEVHLYAGGTLTQSKKSETSKSRRLTV